MSVITEDLLKFSSSFPIDVVGRKNFKGDTILYFTDNSELPKRLNVTEAITEANFDLKTKLFLNPKLPRIGDLEVIEGGGVKTGLYKVAARLVTASGNTSSFSQISDPSPVVEEIRSGGEAQYDGADPQTPGGKTIRINITNIDTEYKFLEIAIITYLTETNTITVRALTKFNITGATMAVDYYSDDQFSDTILLESLISSPAEFSKAKNITQKDNLLFLSNLQAQDFSGVDEEMQTIADGIKIHYTVTSHVQDPSAIIRRGEITTSAGDTSDWNEGQNLIDSSVRLKPGGSILFNNYKNPEFTQKFKGWQRDEVYSLAIVPIFTGGIYGTAYHIPGDLTVTNDATDQLRGYQNDDGTVHHRMPSITKEPVVTSTELSPGAHTVSLNIIGLEPRNVVFSDALKLVLEGYVIVRQRRQGANDGIVVAQGIAKNFYDHSNSTITPMPQNGKTGFFAGGGNDLYGNKALSDDPGEIEFDIADNYFAFYSPDLLHGVVSEDVLSSADTIRQVSIRALRRVADNRKAPNGNSKRFGAYFCDSADLSNDGAANKPDLGINKALTFMKTISPFSSEIASSIPLPDGKILSSRGVTNMVVGKILNSNLNREDTKFPIGSFSSGSASFIGTDLGYTIHAEQESMEIYTVYNMNTNTYGLLSTAEYIKVKEFYFDENPGTTINMFGGDVFISRYSFLIGEKLIGGVDQETRVNIETYIETRGNYAYRHYNQVELDGSAITAGTMPYAPKFRELLNRDPSESGILGVWDFDTALGSSIGYNKQYNFENTLKTYFLKDETFIPITNFPNKIIYSLQSLENEQFDAYRVFLTNNFHDIPKETGEIENTFEYNNILYAHTPHALWRTFVNERTFTNTTSGDVVLGNGGLFPLPSEKIYTQDGGFAGSGVKWAATNTPFGRIFVDTHQKKVFLLSGSNKLENISSPHLEKYFNDNMWPTDDNRLRVGYDPIFKRVFISVTPAVLLSYSLELQSWNSFHVYFPESYSYLDNKLYCTDLTGKLEEMSTGLPGTFFGSVFSSELQFIINEDPTATKEFRNIKWIQEFKNTIFSRIRLYTDTYNTNFITPILVSSFIDEQNFLPLGEQHVDLIGGEYRMTIPPDDSEVYSDELFRPSIKGKYAVVELVYVPDSTPLVLEHFETEYIKVTE